MLVVDESYVEFAPDPVAASVLPGADRDGLPDNVPGVPDNVIVLRSPSKFFGLAGARVGVAWSPSAGSGRCCAAAAARGPSPPWRSLPVVAALADRAWVAATHAALRSDACWLGDHLCRIGGRSPRAGRRRIGDPLPAAAGRRRRADWRRGWPRPASGSGRSARATAWPARRCGSPLPAATSGRSAAAMLAAALERACACW